MKARVMVTKKDVKKTLNGFTIIRSRHWRRCSVPDAHLICSLPLGAAQATIRGNFLLTVGEAKRAIGTPCSVLFCKAGRTRIMQDSETLLTHLFAMDNGRIVRISTPRVFLVPYSEIPCRLCLFKMISLRKLVLKDTFVRRIDLRDQKLLRYASLSNLGLRSIKFGDQPLEYCNVSNNRLESCSVNARVLNASKNRIRCFASSRHFHYLNMSRNPLRYLSCSVDILYIKHTKLRDPIVSNARKIVADGTKGLQMGRCQNLRSLSASSCGLQSIDMQIKHVKCLCARNNYLQDLPALDALEYADLSGNSLFDLKAEKIKSINLSKNNLQQFDLSKYPDLAIADLSFTTLDRIIKDKSGRCNGIYRLNDMLSKRLKIFKMSPCPKHICKKSNAFIFHHALQIQHYGEPIVVFVTVSTRCAEDVREELVAFLGHLVHERSVLDLFDRFVESACSLFATTDQAHKSGFILATKKIVAVQNCGLEMLVVNFAECVRVRDPKKIRVFYNIARWSVFPIFCHLCEGAEERCFRLYKGFTDFYEIFQFLGFYCPLSLEFAVQNTPELLENPRAETAVCFHSLKISRQAYAKDFAIVLQERDSVKIGSRTEILGYNNIDFNMNFYKDEHLSLFITTSNPVFAFVHFYHNCRIDPLIYMEKLNILHILDTYCKAFCGRYIEKNYKFCIVGFNNPIASALWGLRVQETLRAAGIDVGIGISEDTVFRTENAGQVTFGGPALNKLSRIVDLGVGIFISDFLNISHPQIELVNEGDRLYKGFKNRDRIYSVHLRRKYLY